jgi:hypothetical protein
LDLSAGPRHNLSCRSGGLEVRGALPENLTPKPSLLVATGRYWSLLVATRRWAGVWRPRCQIQVAFLSLGEPPNASQPKGCDNTRQRLRFQLRRDGLATVAAAALCKP